MVALAKMSTSNDEVITDIVRVIAEKYNFAQNATITFDRGSNKVGGFMGEIVPIIVEAEAKKKVMNLIAKIAAKNENVRAAAPIAECFENEIIVYETVLTALENLQLRANVPEPFTSTAKVYAISKEEECIVFENLKTSGFEMLHSRQLLDGDHLKFILSRYGEFHALSFALKILEPQIFQEISNELKNMWGITFTERRNGRVIGKCLESTSICLRKKGLENRLFNNYMENFMEWMKKMVYSEEKEFFCFIHGDCWSNNFLFKYKTDNGEKVLEDIKILDWQYGNIGPPVHDLSFIIFSSASKEIFDDLETYLSIYHESLTKFLAYFNLDVNVIFPFQELKRQWMKYYHFGAILGSFIRRVKSFNDEEAIDPANYTDDSEYTHFDAAPDIPFDEDYLAENMRILFDYFNKIEDGKI